MAARTPREAVESLASPLRQALSCFAGNVIFVQRDDPTVGATALTTANGDPVPLRDATGALALALGLRLHYRVVGVAQVGGRLSRHELRVVAYSYGLLAPGEPPRQFLRFDWHPHVAGIPFPHVHVVEGVNEASAVTPRTHIPTGFLTPRDLLAFAMRDLGVAVQQHVADWQRRVIRCDAAMRAALAWAAEVPP